MIDQNTYYNYLQSTNTMNNTANTMNSINISTNNINSIRPTIPSFNNILQSINTANTPATANINMPPHLLYSTPAVNNNNNNNNNSNNTMTLQLHRQDSSNNVTTTTTTTAAAANFNGMMYNAPRVQYMLPPLFPSILSDMNYNTISTNTMNYNTNTNTSTSTNSNVYNSSSTSSSINNSPSSRHGSLPSIGSLIQPGETSQTNITLSNKAKVSKKRISNKKLKDSIRDEEIKKILVDVHTDVPDALVKKRKYVCEICAHQHNEYKAFTTSGHLARHKRIHSGEKKFVCSFEECNQKFSRKDNMTQHYKTHLKKIIV